MITWVSFPGNNCLLKQAIIKFVNHRLKSLCRTDCDPSGMPQWEKKKDENFLLSDNVSKIKYLLDILC